jgi:hypothetical protein
MANARSDDASGMDTTMIKHTDCCGDKTRWCDIKAEEAFPPQDR